MESTTERPVIFGEVLYDTFPDGASILGGAPFNVAWNLKGLGCDPVFVSAVGDDPAGKNVLAAMESWDMDRRNVAIDPNHPTGTVTIELSNGQPTFSILPDQAYDFIPSPGNIPLSSKTAIIYHGSLALRSEKNRKTLDNIHAKCGGEVFLDVNLRSPWWEKKSVVEMLERASWVKLNDDEAEIIGGEEITDANQLQAAEALRKRFSLKGLILTRGSKGALIATQDETIARESQPVTSLADTVGAGDAFASVVILGLLRGWETPAMLESALAFASHVCGMRGATSPDRKHYDAFINQFKAHR